MQLCTKLEEAYSVLHFSIGAYAHAGPNTDDPIYAIDFQELRDKIKAAWTALSSSWVTTQAYNGDGLRVKKNEYGTVTYYLRSTVLGGQVVGELNGSGGWQRGYVYSGSSLLAVQQSGVFWVHEDPVTKSKRVTDVNGYVVSAVELDPWGADTNASWAQAFQPRKYTSYDRDANGSDEAMFRRYNRKHARFDQPDRYDGSYDFGDPQSFNRYAYVQNDPGNFVDPTGLMAQMCGLTYMGDGRYGFVCYGDVLPTDWYNGPKDPPFDPVPLDPPQNSGPTGRPSQALAGCVFDISITNNGLLNSKQLQAMKDEISRVFATAGQEINFVSSNPNYYLNVNGVGANYTNKSDAVGVTPLNGTAVTNNGRVFVDRLTSSATRNAASSTAFNQNSNALAVGLGRAGSHEISHYLLQQNFDSSAITGVMHSGFKGSEWFGKSSEGLWKFTPAQIKQLNSLCGR